MNWDGEGYILSVRKHGETSAIVEIFTDLKGRHLGLVRGGVGRRLRPVLQIGNKVRFEWRARLDEHLGYLSIEPMDARAAELMNERLSLAGLNSLSAMVRATLPEREVFPKLYQAFGVIIDNLHDVNIWPSLYVKWELGLLAAAGYRLDLSRCAATGQTDSLIYVSPRTGRAVSAEAGYPYREKLLTLPQFLISDFSISNEDIIAGLKLTGYFLETRLQTHHRQSLPEARSRMIQKLSQELVS